MEFGVLKFMFVSSVEWLCVIVRVRLAPRITKRHLLTSLVASSGTCFQTIYCHCLYSREGDARLVWSVVLGFRLAAGS